MFRRFLILLVVGLGYASPAISSPVFALVGTATSSGGTVTLTQDGVGGSDGAAWYTTPLSTGSSFSVTFDFSLSSTLSSPQADGISFALQGVGASALGIYGGGVGYDGLGAVGSVIRTYTNNQAGLDTTGTAGNAPTISSQTGGALTDLGSLASITGTQTVSYDAVSKILSLSETIAGYSFTQAVVIDLAGKFGSKMYAGFTGADGGATSTQKISNVSISVPAPTPLLLMLAGGLGLIGATRLRRRAG